ncbi:outer membrane protein A [compost metagenome]
MKTIFLSALVCMSSLAYANQDSATSSTLELTKEETQMAPSGILPFIGAGGGYTGYENVGAAEGVPATLKLLGSWYLESPWVFDAGYGFNNQQFSQDSAQSTAITDGAMELAARFRTDNRWQMGVVGNQFFSQGANYSASQGDAQFVGFQLLKEFNMTPSWLARLGGRAMSLTNNTDGLVNMYMIDLQIGWNPQAYKPSARSAEVETTPTDELVEVDEYEVIAPVAPVRPVTYQEAEPASALRDVDFSELTNSKPIEFASARASVSTADQRRLSKLAKALEDNKELFERVEIHGFADKSGSVATNQRISQERADRVRSLLQKDGLTNVDIVAMGKGSEGSTSISKEDRRAELVFIGVKDEQALREALSSIE